MSNTKGRAKGNIEETGGAIQKNIGRAIGNDRVAAKGKAKELKGKARIVISKAAERAKGKVEETAGIVKKKVGHVIDDEQTIAEGKAKQVKGEIRQKANK